MNEQEQRTLEAGLKALANRTRNASASPRVERAVLAEMDRLSRGRSTTGVPMAPFLALAACLLAAVGVALWLMGVNRPLQTAHLITPSGFVDLPNAAALPEMESASIVRVSLPPSALPQYGMVILPEISAPSIEAELLVGQDGQARAIRLVRNSNTQRSTP